MPLGRDNIFRQISTQVVTTGGTQVSWELSPHLRHPLPYRYRLQLAECNGGFEPNAAWIYVGAAEENVWTLTDPSQRWYANDRTVAYRVELTTPVGVYYSPPVPPLGGLNRRDVNIARNILRLEMLAHKLGSRKGFLYKRKLCGEVCVGCCRDAMTGQVTDSQCEICFGTEYVGGYYTPIPAVFANTDPTGREPRLDPARGNTDEVWTRGRMPGLPPLLTRDIFVDERTDERWVLGQVRTLAEMRGIPLVYSVELKLLPASDIVYQLPRP